MIFFVYPLTKDCKKISNLFPHFLSVLLEFLQNNNFLKGLEKSLCYISKKIQVTVFIYVISKFLVKMTNIKSLKIKKNKENFS